MKVTGKIWDFLKKVNETNDYKVVLLWGGASSSKSKTMYRFLIAEMLQQPGIVNFVFRKYGPSIQSSVWADCIEVLHELNIYSECRIILDKSERMIEFQNKAMLKFKSLDSAEKVKSIDMNNAVFEELNEFTLQDFFQIKLRTRRKNPYGRNRIYGLFNPVSKASFCYTEFFEKEHPETIKCHSTYKDNPFLPEDIKNDIETFRDVNPEWYEIYGKGQFGNFIGAIYTHIKPIKPFARNVQWDSIFYGVDWGFKDPLACIKIGKLDKQYYIIEEFYRTEQTTSDLIAYLENQKCNKNDYIYCDSANPDRIEELRRAGYNAYPAVKGKESIKNGINTLKMQEISVFNNCYNTIKEINSYCWKETKDGQILDEPEDRNNHALDAIRYAITSDLGENREIYIAPTLDYISRRTKGFL